MFTIGKKNNPQIAQILDQAAGLVKTDSRFCENIIRVIERANPFDRNYRTRILSRFENQLPQGYETYWGEWLAMQKCDAATAFNRLLVAIGPNGEGILVPMAASVAKSAPGDCDAIVHKLHEEIDRICPTALFVMTDKTERAWNCPDYNLVRHVKERMRKCIRDGILHADELSSVILPRRGSLTHLTNSCLLPEFADFLEKNCTGIEGDILKASAGFRYVFTEYALDLFDAAVNKIRNPGCQAMLEFTADEANAELLGTFALAAEEEDFPVLNHLAVIIGKMIPDGCLKEQTINPGRHFNAGFKLEKLRTDNGLPVWEPLERRTLDILERLALPRSAEWCLSARELVEVYKAEDRVVIRHERIWQEICMRGCMAGSRDFYLDMWRYDHETGRQTLRSALKVCSAHELLKAQFSKSPEKARELLLDLAEYHPESALEAACTDVWAQCDGFAVCMGSMNNWARLNFVCKILENGLPKGCGAIFAGYVAENFGTERNVPAAMAATGSTSVLEILFLMRRNAHFPADLLVRELEKAGIAGLLASAAAGDETAKWAYAQALGCDRGLRRKALALIGTHDWFAAGGPALHDIRHCARLPVDLRLPEGRHHDMAEALEEGLVSGPALDRLSEHLLETMRTPPETNFFTELAEKCLGKNPPADAADQLLVALHVFGPEACLEAVVSSSGHVAGMFNQCLAGASDTLRKRALKCLGTRVWIRAGGFALCKCPVETGIGCHLPSECIPVYMFESALLDDNPQRLTAMLAGAENHLEIEEFARLVARFVSVFRVGFEFLDEYVSPAVFKRESALMSEEGFSKAAAVFKDGRLDARYAR